MKLVVQVSISYSDVFDDFNEFNIHEALKTIPTKNSLEVICHFLAQLHTKEADFAMQIEFLRTWINRIPGNYHQKIEDFIHRNLNDKIAEFNFLNNVSSLILISYILENNQNKLPYQSSLTPAQELNIFKAYLWCSKEWIDKQKFSPNAKSVDEFVESLLPNQIPYAEILELKDFRLQFLKAINFFKFCEVDPDFNTYLSIFLNQKKVKSWLHYLVQLLSIYANRLQFDPIPSITIFQEENISITEWLDTLCIDTVNFRIDKDFLNIRITPVYKFNENQYLFLNLNFFVDKFFQGIKFDFANTLIENKATYKGKPIMKVPQFLSIIGNVYSETVLFYEIMQYCFKNKDNKKITGVELKASLGAGFPDYYMRNKGKVFLFEYKNELLGKDFKHSYDFNTIKKEIFKKFVCNEDNDPKGVTQLVNYIQKYINGDFKPVDNYSTAKPVIFPILVYDTFDFTVPGVNYILNLEFQKQIEGKGFDNKVIIKDLVMIDLDSLIKFQDFFNSGKIKLNHAINEHLVFTRSNVIFDKISSFNYNLHYRMRKLKYSHPAIFEKSIRELIKEYT